MKRKTQMITFGFLSWLIPFSTAFLFFTSDGEIRIEQMFFKSIMIVVGSLVGVILLVKYFKNIKRNYIKEGIAVGITWLFINWILDITIFLSFAEMAYFEWFTQIGLRYLIIPIISIGMGYIAAQKNK